MLGFIIHVKVNKTPNTLESGGKIDIFCQVSLEEFKRLYKFWNLSITQQIPAVPGVCCTLVPEDCSQGSAGRGRGKVFPGRERRTRERKQRYFLVHLSEGRNGPSWSEPWTVCPVSSPFDSLFLRRKRPSHLGHQGFGLLTCRPHLDWIVQRGFQMSSHWRTWDPCRKKGQRGWGEKVEGGSKGYERILLGLCLLSEWTWARQFFSLSRSFLL